MDSNIGLRIKTRRKELGLTQTELAHKLGLKCKTSVSTRKSGKKYKYSMYVCDYGRRNYHCDGTAISEKRLEKIMLKSLESELSKYNIKITLDTDDNNYENIKKCKDRLKRLKTLFEMGDIGIDEYKSKRDALVNEIETYSQHGKKEPIKLDTNWKEVYEKLDIQHKNAFWKSIIDYIEIPTRKATEVNIYFK